jgi:PAN domain
MTRPQERLAVFIFGVVFVSTLLVLAVALPNPTQWQYQIFRFVLALAAAGVAAFIPGSLEISVSNWLKAGGALAVFALVVFKSPAALVAAPVELMGPLEPLTNRQGSDFSRLPRLVGTPQECSSLCSTNVECKAMTYVKRPDFDAFGGGDCWLKSAIPASSAAGNMISAVKARNAP